jgi:uncharacterized membrane protein
MIWWLLACNGKEESVVDTAAEHCKEVPLVNYDNFGQGFMTENCQGCHATTTPNRYGAPEEVFFDSVEDCWRWKERILTRSLGEEATMPPNGGVDADDRTRLGWWLICGEEGF